MRIACLAFSISLLASFAAWPQAAQPDPPLHVTEHNPAHDPASRVLNATESSAAAPDVATAYWQARSLMEQGAWIDAREVLENALLRFPDSRLLHAQLCDLLWYLYQTEKGHGTTLEEVVEEAKHTVQLGLTAGVVDVALASLLAESLGQLGDLKALDQIFAEAMRLEPSPTLYVAYAKGLALLNDPRAEAVLRETIARGGDTASARIAYAEWLLEQGRDSEVLWTVELKELRFSHYVHFLRGVALERLGRLEEAKAEYQEYAPFNSIFSAPGRFRICESELQGGADLRFDGEGDQPCEPPSPAPAPPPSLISKAQVIEGLSYLLAKEAFNESEGGIRAEGYVVRNRVLRDNLRGCPFVTSDGASQEEHYRAVMCQGNGRQFNGVCLPWCHDPQTVLGCTPKPLPVHQMVAFDVFHGLAPDPVGQHCPAGIAVAAESWCNPSMRCRGDMETFRMRGAVFNFGVATAKPCQQPLKACPTAKLIGKVCGNGYRENCFYINPENTYWPGRSPVRGSLNVRQDGAIHPDPFFVTTREITRLEAHLEGPEGLDLFLCLVMLDPKTGRAITIASSNRQASVEDLVVYVLPGRYYWAVTKTLPGAGEYTLWISPDE